MAAGYQGRKARDRGRDACPSDRCATTGERNQCQEERGPQQGLHHESGAAERVGEEARDAAEDQPGKESDVETAHGEQVPGACPREQVRQTGRQLAAITAEKGQAESPCRGILDPSHAFTQS